MRCAIEPLVDYLSTRYATADEPVVSIRSVCRIIGLNPGTYYRWVREGGIPIYKADRIAIGLGLHPLLIWPDYHHLEDAA